MARLITLLVMIGILTGGPVWAATVDNSLAPVPVTASILGSCTINTAGSLIAFGSLDNGATTPAYVATVTDPTITCTNTVPYTITDDTGANEAVAGVAPLRLYDGVVDYIDYSIAYPGANVGTGVPQAMNITANMLANASALKAAGGYTDQIVFTVTW